MVLLNACIFVCRGKIIGKAGHEEAIVYGDIGRWNGMWRETNYTLG